MTGPSLSPVLAATAAGIRDAIEPDTRPPWNEYAEQQIGFAADSWCPEERRFLRKLQPKRRTR